MKLNYKICHLSSAHPGDDIRIFRKECVSLVKAGFDVVYIFTGPENEEKVIEGVRCISLKKRKGRLKRMWGSVNDVYHAALAEKAHAYHLHDPELLRIMKKLRKKGARVIYDAHEDVPRQILGKYWIPRLARKQVSYWFGKFEDGIAAKCNGIIAATPFIAKRFAAVNPYVSTINNYPFLREFTPVEQHEKQAIVIYAGGLTLVRGVYEMVQTMNELDQTTLVLAGAFAPESLLQEAQTWKGWEKVNYIGQVARPVLQTYLRKASAGLVLLHNLPNYVDSQPIKMYEYMSAGIPVIASDFPLWKNVVEGHACGICVNPNDIRQIAEAIRFIIQHPAEAKRMGENGRKAIESHYNWETQAEALVNFYKQLLIV